VREKNFLTGIDQFTETSCALKAFPETIDETSGSQAKLYR
jgi:hypothetical protein